MTSDNQFWRLVLSIVAHVILIQLPWKPLIIHSVINDIGIQTL